MSDSKYPTSPTSTTENASRNRELPSKDHLQHQTEGRNRDEDMTLVWALRAEFEKLQPLGASVPKTLKLVQDHLSTLAASLLSESAIDANEAQGPSRVLPASPKPTPAPLAPNGVKYERINIPTTTGYNFVGRILGPGGRTLKTIAEKTRCRIAIRGKGSVRPDKVKHYCNTPGFEHLTNDVLHVHIEPDKSVPAWEVEKVLDQAKKTVNLYLIPVPEEIDTLKKQQLSDLARMRGSYDDKNSGPGRSRTSPSSTFGQSGKLTLEDIALASSPRLGIHSPPPPPTPTMDEALYHQQSVLYNGHASVATDALSPVSLSPSVPVPCSQFPITPSLQKQNYFVGNEPHNLSYDSTMVYRNQSSHSNGSVLCDTSGTNNPACGLPNMDSASIHNSWGSSLSSSDTSPEPPSVFRHTQSAHSVSQDGNDDTARCFDRAIGSARTKRN